MSRQKSRQGSQARRRRQKPSNRRESTLAILDRLLAKRVPVKINGETAMVPAAEAIVLQLLQKALSGNGRAWRALLRYRDFASRRSSKKREVTFVDTDYTAAFANSLRKDPHD
ncbi:DUF5681 domain-containing protein [Methylocella silvestris]|uniref:DUF5681 domain-containing protein n=1 Tax=Methylocella silvestris TaxID=199596 RepID=UPI00268ED1B2